VELTVTVFVKIVPEGVPAGTCPTRLNVAVPGGKDADVHVLCAPPTQSSPGRRSDSIETNVIDPGNVSWTETLSRWSARI